MTTGEWLGASLLFLILLWAVADVWVWKTGRQTLSQWVIRESKKRLSFTLGALVVCVGFTVWLIVHFELPQILIEHLK